MPTRRSRTSSNLLVGLRERLDTIKSHDFRGKTWKIKWRAPRRLKSTPPGHNLFGLADANTNTLTIFPSKDPWDLLDTVLDETTHANFFDLDNDAVREAVQAQVELLKRMGMKISFE